MAIGSRHVPANPPKIPGYQYTRFLGRGGFADVFLYRQEFPERLVAVKVLSAEALTPEIAQRFYAEANLMARLSHHPSIVTIYQAAISSDGRPYLIMEYCSRPGPGVRYVKENISTQEALRTGIRLAAAVETVHRAGIAHRDIKPGNILFNDFGWPALSDFGIASVVGWADTSGGISVPWAPPEVFVHRVPGSFKGDIYSLGATIYALLARRSPFEIPGGKNGPDDLISRIKKAPLQPVRRSDIPQSVNHVFAKAMAKNPADRYDTALKLGEAFQRIETELGFPLTAIEVSEVPFPSDAGFTVGESPDLLGAVSQTRIAPIVAVGPQSADALTSNSSPTGTSDQTVASLPAGTPTPGFDRAGHSVPQTWGQPAADHVEKLSAPNPIIGLPGERPAAPRQLSNGLYPRQPAFPSAQPGTVLGASGHGDLVRLGSEDSAKKTGKTRGRLVERAAASVIIVCAVVGVGWMIVSRSNPGSTANPQETRGSAVVEAVVPSPENLVGVRNADDSVTFTWTNPSPETGDQYQWGLVDFTEDVKFDLVDGTSVTIPAADVSEIDRVCVEVSLVRKDRRASTLPIAACVD